MAAVTTDRGPQLDGTPGPRQGVNEAKVRHQNPTGVSSLGSDPGLQTSFLTSSWKMLAVIEEKEIHPPIGKTPPALDPTERKSWIENH